MLYTKKSSSYWGTGEVGPWRIKRCEEKPILLANVVFILQPRLRDIDNKLTSQKDKKNRGVGRGVEKTNPLKGEVTPGY